MPKGRADIANAALRIFLHRVGKSYDEMRKLKPYGGRRAWRTVLDDFDSTCCYCECPLDEQTATEDHLVGINKSAMGLHAWGNVVPACAPCNKNKHHKDWLTYLQAVSPVTTDLARRVARVEAFQAKYKYAPGVGLQIVADTLYEEIGELTMMLINLKIRRAEAAIAQLGTTTPAVEAPSPSP